MIAIINRSLSARTNFTDKNKYFGERWGIALIQVFNRRNSTNEEGLEMSKEAVERSCKEFKWFNPIENTKGQVLS